METTARRTGSAWWGAIAAVAVGACGAEPTPAAIPPTWASMQAIFAASCNFSTCHGGRSGSLTLTGDAADVRAALLDPSFEVPRLRRVAPRDPANSYLLHKLDDRMSELAECRVAQTPPVCGVSMPQGEALLTAAQRAAVRAWIAAGAPGP